MKIDPKFGICDVKENYNFYFKFLLGKLHDLFIIDGLPDSIDVDSLKNQLFLNGCTCFTKFNDKLYCVIGNIGGEPNEYYYPTIYTVANPVLGSKRCIISGLDQDSVMIYNTRSDKSLLYNNASGLYQLIKTTATLLADNIVSISCAQINSRVQSVYTAESHSQALTGEKILKDMYNGKPYRVVPEDEYDKLTVHNNNSQNTQMLTQLIELQQYILSQFYMNIGIKYNGEIKKQRMITDEINFQDNFLKINLDTMLSSWQKGFDEVNKLFGTNISIKVNPLFDDVLEDDEEAASSEEGDGDV